MKVDEELLRRAMSAAFYSQNIVAGPEAERTMRRALAAVAPLIRRAALEEAAGVADVQSGIHYIDADNLSWDVEGAGKCASRAMAAAKVAAAIRALDA
jgi:hypothetical protein